MFFRKMGFVGSALLLSGGLAMAADLPEMGYVEQMEPAPLPPAGFYASLHASYVMPGDVDAEFELGGSTVDSDIDAEDGYHVGGSIGYDFNSMIGVEAELGFSSNDVDSITAGGTTSPTSGDTKVLMLMGNVIIGNHYDRWRPYLGAGLGAAHVSLDISTALPSDLDDSDWAFAAQAFAGLDYSLTDTVSLGARYRYVHIGSTDYTDTGGSPVSLDSFGSQAVEAVLKVKFGG